MNNGKTGRNLDAQLDGTRLTSLLTPYVYAVSFILSVQIGCIQPFLR